MSSGDVKFPCGAKKKNPGKMETFMLSLRLDVEKYTSIIEYPKLTILTILT